MANNKSALKRVDIAERNRLRNKSYNSAVKTLMKKCLKAVELYKDNPNQENLETIKVSQGVAYSKIDKAVKHGIIHPNNGARKKSRLAKAIKKVMFVSANTEENPQP